MKKLVVVGGGTAGWLAAASIAARARPGVIEVTLVESPDLPTIGVGEGTWPTMRRTLARIGIPEAEFLLETDASFKQGSRFIGWRDGGSADQYLHPFTPPPEADALALVAGWGGRGDFAEAVAAQARVVAADLAPRQRAMPDYAGALNYAYHLDAVKLAALLARHATGRLGVRHVRDHVLAVERSEDGDIAAVRTRENGAIAGDLFIDCTGHAALLIGDVLGVPFHDCGDVLFNDRALAAQVPVPAGSPIASSTHATAHAAGWIWDIGLPTRRGIGCVWSSRHMDDAGADAVLRAYLAHAAPFANPDSLAFRKLSFRSGHRERFWERNCLAIGLSAGFLEPLEASAIVLIELSLDQLLDNFPHDRAGMDFHAQRFNTLFGYRWERIIEFLKLHYVPSVRTEPYWQEHRETVPARLAELLRLWRQQPPSRQDLPMMDEIFPAASYQYVLYGMGFPLPAEGPLRPPAALSLAGVTERARQLTASLPTNRAYLDALRAHASQMEASL